MRPLNYTALALSLVLAAGVGACSDSGNQVPADQPAQTGSLPAEPAAPLPAPDAPAAAPEQPIPDQSAPEPMTPDQPAQ